MSILNELENILEMAKPRDADLSKIYYHGTSTDKSAEGILKNGISVPDLTLRRGLLRPMEGKVYITPNIKYAYIYGLGANMIGHDYPKKIKVGEENIWIFSIDGNQLNDIEPDEDSVGEILYDVLNDKIEIGWLKDLAYYELDDEVYDDEEIDMSLLDAVKFGEYGAWAVAGKLLNAEMSDMQKLDLIDMGTHIAHHGNLQIKNAFKLHKSKNKLIKTNASNFFDYAEKIK